MFFSCHLARFAWSAIREAAGINWNLASSADLLACLATVHGSVGRVLWSSVGVFLWALWHIRNKLTIEAVFPSHPTDCIFKCSIFLQKWSPLGRRQDADVLQQALL